jgi:hypothetical protein
MRKPLMITIAALLATVVIGVFLAAAFFGHIPLGEPTLRIEFYPPPPWQVRPGNSFEVTMGIANDAWLLAWAKAIRVDVFMPEGFTSDVTGTNECEIYFGSLHGRDGLGRGLTIVASNDVTHGNYVITIKVSGENIREKTFSLNVTVVT